MGSISLILVSESPIRLEGVKQMFAGKLDFAIVATAMKGQEAINIVKERKPDIALIDISTEEPSGTTAAREIKNVSENTKVIVYTENEEEEIAASISSEADGIFIKSNFPEEDMPFITYVYEGEKWIAQQVAATLLGLIEKEELDFSITQEEKEVLNLIAEGYSNKNAAVKLNKPPEDINALLTSLIAKLAGHEYFLNTVKT